MCEISEVEVKNTRQADNRKGKVMGVCGGACGLMRDNVIG